MPAARKIAVAGATGRAGRHVVDVLRAGGHDVVPMSRSGGVDVITGDGLAEALVSLATEAGPDATAGISIPEIAGPREESLVDMAKLLVARRGDPVRIEGVSDPADPDHDLNESGGLLPGPKATLAGPTFEE